MVSTTGVLKHNSTHHQFHPAIRIIAKIFSYLLHPLFLPLYTALFLIYEVRLFPDRTGWQKSVIFIQFILYYTFLPLMTTLLSKGLGFISSVHMKTQKDRIIPYVLCEIFYFWAWYVFRNLHFPREVVLFALGVFLATSLGLILNAYMKISMHMIGAGVLVAFMFLAGTMTDLNYGPYISLAVLVAGVSGTARLIESSHHPKEIYAGFFAGMIATLIAYFFV